MLLNSDSFNLNEIYCRLSYIRASSGIFIGLANFSMLHIAYIYIYIIHTYVG